MARLVTILWLLSSVIEFTVWLLICVIGRHLVPPFWIYTAGVGGTLVAVLWWLSRATTGSRP